MHYAEIDPLNPIRFRISQGESLWHFFTPLDVRSASDRRLKTDVRLPWNGVKRPRPIDLVHSLGRPTACPETKWVWRPTHQSIKWSSTEYLAMFTRFGSHTRNIGKDKFVWFRNNIHPTNSTKLHWTERQHVVKELNSKLTFFWSYEQRMVVVSRNTGSAPLIGSKVIRDRASDGSVWSEKGPRI